MSDIDQIWIKIRDTDDFWFYKFSHDMESLMLKFIDSVFHIFYQLQRSEKDQSSIGGVSINTLQFILSSAHESFLN